MAIIVTDISGRTSGAIQKYRTYVYEGQSLAYNATAAGTVSNTFTLENSGRKPKYAGIYNLTLPADMYLQSISLSDNSVVITLYSTTASSGTLTFDLITVQ